MSNCGSRSKFLNIIFYLIAKFAFHPESDSNTHTYSPHRYLSGNKLSGHVDNLVKLSELRELYVEQWRDDDYLRIFCIKNTLNAHRFPPQKLSAHCTQRFERQQVQRDCRRFWQPYATHRAVRWIPLYASFLTVCVL